MREVRSPQSLPGVARTNDQVPGHSKFEIHRILSVLPPRLGLRRRRLGTSDFGLRTLDCLGFVALFLSPGPLFALVTNETSAEITPLRPPRPELPPSFLEQHALTIGVASFLGLLLLAILIWFALRPRTIAETPPDQAARRELQSLQAHPQDPQLLTRVSHVVRRYLSRAFGLPEQELTTAEFCRALHEQERAGPALAEHAARVLQYWDEQKFSPNPPATQNDPVTEAGFIVDEGEARLVELNRPELSRLEAERAPQQKG